MFETGYRCTKKFLSSSFSHRIIDLWTCRYIETPPPPNGKNGTIDKEYWWFPIRREASAWSEIQIESRKAETSLSHENCNKDGTVLKNERKKFEGSFLS